MSFALDEHLAYVADTVRIARFKAAIGQVIKTGDCVADLGCGSGILGLLSLQAGAAHVHFIDDGAMIDIARQTLARAGLSAKASFTQGRCQHAVLPESVDALVCDHVGFLGIDYGILNLLQDARKRLLKPGGMLVPAGIRLHIAAIESAPCDTLANGWRAESIPDEFHWLRDFAVNTRHAVNFKREEFIGTPATLARIDFLEEDREFLSWTTELRMERDGTVHGLGGWFECELAAGIWMTNSPLDEQPIKRCQAFLPIGEAVRVKAGDSVIATLMARSSGDPLAWVVEFPATGRRFKHSTWQGLTFSAAQQGQSDPARVPVANATGSARMIVLGYCDGRRSMLEIEQAVLLEHPALFPTTAEISRFVARVLNTDTQ